MSSWPTCGLNFFTLTHTAITMLGCACILKGWTATFDKVWNKKATERRQPPRGRRSRQKEEEGKRRRGRKVRREGGSRRKDALKLFIPSLSPS